MHFPVLVFHKGDIDTVLSKYYYDADSDDADGNFNEQYSVEDAEKMYKKHIKEHPEEKEQYPTIEIYMNSYHGCEYDEAEDAYGYESNNDGMYEWYEVGGRWKNLLPLFKDEKDLDKKVKAALNLKNKKVYEKFRDNMTDYVRINEMNTLNAAIELGIGLGNSIIISEDITPEMILNCFAVQYNKHSEDKEYNSENILDEFFEEIISEDSGRHNGFSKVDFISYYNQYAKLNKTKKGEKYYLTMVDMHT